MNKNTENTMLVDYSREAILFSPNPEVYLIAALRGLLVNNSMGRPEYCAKRTLELFSFYDERKAADKSKREKK